MPRRLARSLVLAAAAAFATAPAIAGLGDDIVVAADGDVVITFVGASTAYNSFLRLGPGGTDFFDNFNTPVNTTYNLGSFTAGTVLDIVLHVINTGDFFRSGPGSGNPDGVPHANLVYDYLGMPGLTFVGFEDLYGGGDMDYNDLQFTFSNLRVGVPNPVPEPETYALLLAGLGALGWLGRRRKAAAAR